MSFKIFSLSQVTSSIQKTISQRYTSSFWVAAEMNRLGYQPSSGHAFPELVEKRDGSIAAQMRAFILKSDMRNISAKFLAGTGEALRDHMKILFLAEVSYSAIHGLSLQIRDIDPTYTLGDLERERQECIQRLKSAGLFDLNKASYLSLAPKTIAVISSNTSKGFEDFLHTLAKASPEIVFNVVLFGAALQGSEAPPAIIAQLDIIRTRLTEFDAVAIIRGGGGDVGLSCYNDFALASAIASFPLPVFIGVGHKSNETVAELVSYGAGITPTAVGEMFVQRCRLFLSSLLQIQQRLKHCTLDVIRSFSARIDSGSMNISRLAIDVFRVEESGLSDSAHRLIRCVNHSLSAEEKNIQWIRQNLGHDCVIRFNAQHQFINLRALPVLKSEVIRSARRDHVLLDSIRENLPVRARNVQSIQQDSLSRIETIVRLNDPLAIIRKGYSVTRVNGKIVSDLNDVKQGDVLITQFLQGTATSIIQKIQIQDE
jgi:exodeoxyribonuclease VII large subunit